MIKCIIVDDERLAQQVIQNHLQKVPGFQIMAICNNATEAATALRNFEVDLIFLDIQLPGITGLNFLRSLAEPPLVILTTAYTEYAVESYEFNVIDYLLKPIEFSRFLKAVNKIEQAKEIVMPARPVVLPTERVYLFFNVGKKKVKVFLDEILYIQSMKEYIRVNTKSKSILTKFKLSQVDELLSENNFLRIHRSFIVAKDKIEAFSATEVELGGKQLPIGRSYKELVMNVLEG